MRFVIAVLLALNISTAYSQSKALYPSPLGVIISVGRFIFDAEENKVTKITVKADGRDENEAKKNAFIAAVQHVSGETLLAERQIHDGKVIHNNVVQYSSGHVSKFVIVDKTVGDNTTLVVDVWVKQTKIHERLTNYSVPTDRVDGQNFSAQITTLIQQTENGDKLIGAVLDDFPRQSFSLTNTNVSIERTDGKFHMHVPVTVAWNEAYVTSLKEALILTKESPKWSTGYGISVGGSTVYFDDYGRWNNIRSNLMKLAVRVSILDHNNNVVATRCDFISHRLITFNKQHMTINSGSTSEQDIIIRNINVADVERMNTLDIKAVNTCRV